MMAQGKPVDRTRYMDATQVKAVRAGALTNGEGHMRKGRGSGVVE